MPVQADHIMPSKGATLPVHALLLVAALAGAVVAQGGYYLPGRVLAAVLVAAAVVVARFSLADTRPVLIACSGLVVWAVVRALVDGSVGAALPTVGSVFCLAGAVVVAQRNNAAERAVLASTVVGVGVLVAVSGWIAVVWRIPSWTTVADGLVRAASTLTYPNASAALLASLSVLSISQQMTRPRSLAQLSATYALLVGLGATLSRAGVLAFVVGLVVLAVLAGVRSTARHVLAPGVGALVAVAALTPTFSFAKSAQPALAVLGLVVGLLITVGLTRLPAVVAVAVAGLVLVGAVVAAVFFADRLLPGRVSLSSPDRTGVVDAALDVVAARPVTGVGPGNAWFTWTSADGNGRVGHLVHNEYLQALVEFGAVGLLLVLGLLVAIFVVVRRGRSPALWAGAVAGLVVLLVHSGLDFLWHIPVSLLTAGLLVGLASSLPKETR
ncbi:hypothetical protein GCM10029964_081710 [Kibdelosporangium lantanae]